MINDITNDGEATIGIATDHGNAVIAHGGICTKLKFDSIDYSPDTKAFIEDLIALRDKDAKAVRPEMPAEASAPVFQAYMHRDAVHGSVSMLIPDGVYRFNLTDKPQDITIQEARKSLEAGGSSDKMVCHRLNSPFPVIAFGVSPVAKFLSVKIPSMRFAYNNAKFGISNLMLTLPQCALSVHTKGNGAFNCGYIAVITADAPRATDISFGYLPLSNMNPGGLVCTGSMLHTVLLRGSPSSAEEDSSTRSLAETTSLFWSMVLGSDWNADLLWTQGLFPGNLKEVFDSLRGETSEYDAFRSIRSAPEQDIPSSLIGRRVGDASDTDIAKAFRALYVLSKPEGHTLLDYSGMPSAPFIGKTGASNAQHE